MIRTAVILAAGEGSRLRGSAASKPLCPVAGRPLIDHALGGLALAGIERVIVVLGYRADEVEAHLRRHYPLVAPAPSAKLGTGLSRGTASSDRPQGRSETPRQGSPELRRRTRGDELRIETVRSNPLLPNGASVLAAAPLLGEEPALLLMCDHLVDPALYARVAAAGAGTGLILGIDRRLGHAWIDPLDVTCVATRQEIEGGDRIVAIGKGLEPHDAYDTGVFAIGPKLVAALKTLDTPSLTEGVRLLAAHGDARVVDCSDLDWIDVDDAAALEKAEEWRGSLAAA